MASFADACSGARTLSATLRPSSRCSASTRPRRSRPRRSCRASWYGVPGEDAGSSPRPCARRGARGRRGVGVVRGGELRWTSRARRRAFLEQARELGARAARLVRPERVHQRRDARAHAALAALAARAPSESSLPSAARGLRGATRSDRRDRSRVSCAMTSSSSVGRAERRARAAGPRACPPRRRRGASAASPLEEAAARAELPEHDAEGVEVDAPVADLLPRDLGRDVAGLREDDAGDRVAAAVVAARGAEVDELHLARVADHHVLRRQIAVHDAERRAVGAGALVDVGERLAPSRARSRRPRPSRCARRSGSRALRTSREAAALDVLDDACTARRCSSVAASSTCATPGWWSCDCTRASSRKRARNDPSWMWSRRIVFTTHGRSAPSMPVVAAR